MQRLKLLGAVEAKQDPEAHQLGKGLSDGLHEEYAREHRGSRLSAGPFGGDDGAQRVFGADSWVVVSLPETQHERRIRSETYPLP